MAPELAGPELAGVVEALEVAGIEVAGIEVGPGGAEPLRSAPRGFDKDHPRIDLLRARGTASRRLPAQAASVSETAARVIDFWTTSEPLAGGLSADV